MLETVHLYKVLIPTVLTFVVGILMTPVLTHYLYRFRVWKKVAGKTTLDGALAMEFNRLHAENEVRTPRMGGIVVWGSVLLSVLILSLTAYVSGNETAEELNYLSRSQTWIPFATLILGALVGFTNDLYDVTHGGAGLRLRVRLIFILTLGLLIGYWFYAKLGVVSIGIPFVGELYLGIGIIGAFLLVLLSLYASGTIDGIDGLSGGVFASIFTAYALIAYAQGQYDIAALSGSIAGGILAFLWFNIPPARFWMTETGSMALTLTLAVIAFMTDRIGNGYGVFVLPLIGLPLVATVLSSLLQIAWKRFFGRKLLRIAPLHHHFESIGWPGYKVTMRYWIVSIIAALSGVIVALAG